MAKDTIIIIVLMLILLGGLATAVVILDKKKKKEEEEAKKISEAPSIPIPMPTNGNGSPSSSSNSAPTQNTNILTVGESKKLAEDMYTFFGWFQNGSDRCYIVKAWLNLSDQNLVYVTEDYIKMYGENPIQRISSASYVCQNAPWATDPDSVLINRLNSLGYY